MRKALPEGTIKVHSNGTKWIKRNGAWHYMKVDGKVGRGTRAPDSYPSSKLPEYIPPPPSDVKLYPTKFDGYYVTEDGDVWTEWHKNPPRRGNARKMNQIPRGGAKADDRYLSVNISLKDEEGRTTKQMSYYAHRLVAETLIPNPNNLPEVDHNDRVKTHNHVNNLSWVTRKENCAFLKKHD